MVRDLRRWGFILFATMFVAALVVRADGAEPAKKKPARKEANPVMQPIQDDANLPRVLLIGDSISIGYTLPVRKLLEGKANVHRVLTNCGPTSKGLAEIDQWLGDKPWDVIHFNWGLHDLKYMGPDGQNLADPQAAGSRQQVPPAEYEANLRQLVQRLKKTGAALVWCATTPVPEGASGRIPEDAAKYNQIAARIMEEHRVAVNDLYAFAKPRLAQIQLPANVHFTSEGSAALAEQVATAITAALAKKRSARSE
ncbi:MAG: SGNH/GDSL hydrolase family protein [Pirellulaceae bacterium]|nr:SGNH/GDSL hydrolase family protein [Pirellulaceae bacterium]